MPPLTAFEAAIRLVERLDQATRPRDVEQVTCNVKATLEELIAKGELMLPERFHEPKPGGYARRLVHHNPELNYAAVAMCWAPGHCTPLHDHAGMWCVEGVVAGSIFVDRYELEEHQEARSRMVKVESIRAGCGACGALIPPHEYHVLGNASSDNPAVTLHVYGGVMDRCAIFVPESGDWFRREQIDLSFDP